MNIHPDKTGQRGLLLNGYIRFRGWKIAATPTRCGLHRYVLLARKPGFDWIIKYVDDPEKTAGIKASIILAEMREHQKELD